MIITICGSSKFKEEMINYKKILQDAGIKAIVHPDYEAFIRGEKQDTWQKIQTEHASAKKENDYIRWYYNAICNSDGILVLNFDKNGIKNYVGGNTLMEIGFAHVNNKRVYLLNEVPEEVSYKDEILAMYDVVLNNDIKKIFEFDK